MGFRLTKSGSDGGPLEALWHPPAQLTTQVATTHHRSIRFNMALSRPPASRFYTHFGQKLGKLEKIFQRLWA
jgi:hypothetical protein